ncbi:MAG TPA: ATP-binding protein, partial [Methanotrichaceae archaeon]|nr:ATP-binding protein [Methanotrichaceae archaeon]
IISQHQRVSQLPGRGDDVGEIVLKDKIEMLHREIEELKQCTSYDPSSKIQLLSRLLSDLRASLEELQARQEMPGQREGQFGPAADLDGEDKRHLDLLEFAPDGYLVTDLYGIIKEANGAASSLLGVDRHFLLCKPMSIFLDESDLKALSAQMDRLKKGEQIPAFEMPMGFHEEPKFLASVSGSPIFANGNLVGMLWLLRDITRQSQAEAALKKSEKALRESRANLERKVQERTAQLTRVNQNLQKEVSERLEAEEALRESERRLIDTIDFLPDATFVIDNEGRVIAWNHAIEALTGIKARDILGKGDYEYAIPFFGERRPILIDLVLRPDSVIERDYANLERRDGMLVGEAYVPCLNDGKAFMWGKAAILYDCSGKIVGAIESIRDITDRKKSEEALLKAKEAAEAAAKAKTEFLATMSHEIRTPMNAVIGMTSLLLDDSLTPEQRDCVETIRSSGDALLAVINDILDLSKIEREGARREYQPLDLHECLKSSIELVASEASKKGLGLTCAIDEAVPVTILSDVNRLRQVLVNLIGNAVKFTESGRISITVVARNLEDGLYEIRFSIDDTGIGIPQESLDKLFQPFSQVDMSNTRRYGGTGLGLAISRRLVELMDGRIWAESIPAKGSIFHFTILARSAEMEEQRAVKEMQSVRPHPRRAIHILLAEDSLVSQKMTMLMLYRLGYRADAVANGLEVLEALKRQHYDVILMDVQMPEMDGLEATRAIRRLWSLGPKIIAITAYALEGDREMCIEAGMDGYLAKPIKIEELRLMLENI